MMSPLEERYIRIGNILAPVTKPLKGGGGNGGGGSSRPRGGGAVLALDGYTTNLWAAWSINKMLTAYAGSAIRVRRSSDNTEQDIGFVGTALDTASLLTFAGAGDAFVVTIYDQTGQLRHYQQATTTKQPRIVASGVYDGFIRFDGTSDGMRNTGDYSGFGANTQFLTHFLRGTLRGVTGDPVYLEHTVNGFANGVRGSTIYYDTATSALQVGAGPGEAASGGKYNGLILNNNVHAYAYDMSGATARVNAITTYVGGTLQARSGNIDAGAFGTQVFASAPFNIGARNNGASNFAQLNLTTHVVYQAFVSAADIATISTRLA